MQHARRHAFSSVVATLHLLHAGRTFILHFCAAISFPVAPSSISMCVSETGWTLCSWQLDRPISTIICSWCIVGDKNSTLLSLFCYCISKHDDWKSIHVQKQCISILKRCICVCLVDRAAFGPERRHSAPLIFAFFRIVRSEPFRRTYEEPVRKPFHLDLVAQNLPPTTWPPPLFSPPHQ